MQREIKFKAKRIDNNEWVIGVPYPINEEGKIFIVNNCKSLNFTKKDTTFEGVEINPETICQFTGLKDKNGNDIYEGDIVRIVSSNEVKEIFYNKCSFGVKVSEGIFAPIYWHNDIEVISNIHD